ncbi:MAG: class C sortase [Lachnospiraceae bacterium]|nr:class C sortase [Lachnospiraceae bacterium]
MKQKAEKKKKAAEGKKKNSWPGTLALVLVFIIGILVLLYPTVSNWWNERAQTRAIFSYDEAVAALSEEEFADYVEAAQSYNQALLSIDSSIALITDSPVEGYEETLDITGTGIMGYVTIEKIDVYLPIYHGTSTSALSAGAGHMEGSSLPVGGESTHSVIVAHRGLPSALMFTRLDEMEVGDTFTITVLDEVLTYEVDQISIVEPDDLEYLYIEEGQDYCTLMTCTPYGINTERLLVRGVRTESEDTTLIRVTADAYKVDTMIVASVVAVPLLLILLVLLLAGTRRKKK